MCADGVLAGTGSGVVDKAEYKKAMDKLTADVTNKKLGNVVSLDLIKKAFKENNGKSSAADFIKAVTDYIADAEAGRPLKIDKNSFLGKYVSRSDKNNELLRYVRQNRIGLGENVGKIDDRFREMQKKCNKRWDFQSNRCMEEAINKAYPTEQKQEDRREIMTPVSDKTSQGLSELAGEIIPAAAAEKAKKKAVDAAIKKINNGQASAAEIRALRATLNKARNSSSFDEAVTKFQKEKAIDAAIKEINKGQVSDAEIKALRATLSNAYGSPSFNQTITKFKSEHPVTGGAGGTGGSFGSPADSNNPGLESNVDFIKILTNLTADAKSIFKLTTIISYVIGFWLVIAALMGLRRSELGSSGSQGGGIAGPIIKFFIGIALIYLPSTIDLTVSAFWGSGGANTGSLAYATIQSPFEVFRDAAIMIVRLIGLVAFISGFVELAHSSDQQAQPGSVAKGMLRVFGGVLALNVVATIRILGGVFGIKIL